MGLVEIGEGKEPVCSVATDGKMMDEETWMVL